MVPTRAVGTPTLDTLRKQAISLTLENAKRANRLSFGLHSPQRTQPSQVTPLGRARPIGSTPMRRPLESIASQLEGEDESEEEDDNDDSDHSSEEDPNQAQADENLPPIATPIKGHPSTPRTQNTTPLRSIPPIDQVQD